jgi:hypothetical membrane protein/ketosteroid isomerase-like protein
MNLLLKLRQRFVYAGLIVSPLLITLIFVFGSLEPGYSNIREMISQLGGFPGSRGFLFNLGVAICGLGLVLFAYYLSYRSESKGIFFSSLLIAVGGLGLFGSALFSCNPGCRNILKEPNLVGTLHNLFTFLSALSLGAAPLAAYVGFRKQPGLRTMSGLSLLMGILTIIPGLIFWASFFTDRNPSWQGLIQRLGLFFPLIWIFIIAVFDLLEDLQFNLDRLAVIQRELQWTQAHQDLDLDQIEEILSDDFQSIKNDGSIHSKTDLLNSYRSGNRYWEIANSSDHMVQVAGKLAILVGRWRGKGINTGIPFDYRARFISIYKKENGSWKLTLERSLEDHR